MKHRVHQSIFRALISFPLMLAGACATAPVETYGNSAPVVPRTWTGTMAQPSTASIPLSHWWEAAHDAELARLIDLAQQRNADVQRAVVRMEQAAAKAGLDSASLFPMVQGNFSESHQHYLTSNGNETVYFNGIPIPIGNLAGSQTNTNGTLTFSYMVDFWGTQRNAARASRQALTSAALDVSSAQWLISTQVAEQYWTYAALRERLPLDEEEIKWREDELLASQTRDAAGEATLDELINTRDRRDAARTQLRHDRDDAAKARLALAVLLDEAPGALSISSASLPQGDVPLPATDIPMAVLDRRPDVRSARLALDAALLRQKAARASYYPSLNLQASMFSGGTALKQILSNPLLSTGLQLALPILDWQNLRYRHALANADVHSAVVELRSRVYKALQDVELASALRSGVVEQNRQARERADDLHALASKLEVRHEFGYASVRELDDARANDASAQRALIDARLAAWKNYMDLAKALGGPL